MLPFDWLHLPHEVNNNRLAIYVDKGAEGRWRNEPYSSGIKHFADKCAERQELLIVREGRNHTVIFPEKEQFLGVVEEDQFIIASQKGFEFNAFIVDKDDPRAVEIAKRNKTKF
ncbi:MAG: hypothetical protein HN705_04800 [Rhodospirillales bacterium]|nr:hypothetical protein [Rhodospirillales bacterium]